MSKVRLVFVVFSLALAGRAEAQPTIYVSNFTGHQVLSIDGTNGGTPTVVFSGAQINSPNFNPEDMTIGPDGKLYICDSLNSKIWRYDPAQPLAAANPQVIVTFTGVYPEGPAFAGSDDLYVNSRALGTQATGGSSGGQGVWVIPNVAAAGTSAPYTPVNVTPFIGNSGEGTAFGEFGNLLVVDQSGNRVLSAPWTGPGSVPNFGTFSPFITTSLSAPVGIAVNTCGDVLVASGTAIQRFGVTKDAASNLSAQFLNTYVTFPRGDVVTYFERDAANTLYVATNSPTAGGKVWRIPPVLNAAGDPITSCSAGVLPSAPLVALKKFSQGSAAPLSNTQLQAVGIAVPATDFTPKPKTFSPANPANTWTFGHYTLTVSYKQVVTTFTQTFTSLSSRPVDVTFTGSGFRPGTVGMRFPSLGGFVVQLMTKSQPPGCASFATCGVPVAGVDYAPTDASGPAFQVGLAFRDPLQGFQQPGLAHSSDDTRTGTYTDNVTADFWVLFDQATRGSGGIWRSKYVPFDSPLQAGLAFPLTVTVNQPALSGNPLFNLGQNFTVSITVTDANQQPVPGLVLRLSAARTSPLPIVLETVRGTNRTTIENVMNDNGNGKYAIGVDTALFTGGTGQYQFTIFGGGFAPFVFFAQFRKQ